MFDYQEKIESIYQFLKRSEEQQKNAYAYEIYMLQGMEITPLTPRTSGSENFKQDIETAVDKAKQVNCTLKVEVFGGKSPNAKHVNSYKINFSAQQEPQFGMSEIQNLIREEVRQANQSNEMGLNGLNNFIGALSGKNDGAEGLEGLLGLVTTLNSNNTALDRVNYQKQLDDFKNETRYQLLEEKYQAVQAENAELKAKNEIFENENRALLNEKTDLEGRLANYAPNELMKRVAVGVLSGIGGRILSNSPKTAELLGLTPNELKGALGVVEENETPTAPTTTETNVEIEEVDESQSPEEQQNSQIIERIYHVLKEKDLPTNTKIISIIAYCLEQNLLDKTLEFLNSLVNGADSKVTETENQ